jgi:hypothetical protein
VSRRRAGCRGRARRAECCWTGTSRPCTLIYILSNRVQATAAARVPKGMVDLKIFTCALSTSQRSGMIARAMRDGNVSLRVMAPRLEAQWRLRGARLNTCRPGCGHSAAVCATHDARRATRTLVLACVASHPRIDHPRSGIYCEESLTRRPTVDAKGGAIRPQGADAGPVLVRARTARPRAGRWMRRPARSFCAVRPARGCSSGGTRGGVGA